MEVTYNVGDLKYLISESSNEFKAKLGDGVESNNKKNNGKAYDDAEKRAKDFGADLKKEAKPKVKYQKDDANGTLLDYEMENVPEDYKKRVEANVLGYSSIDAMNNGIEKQDDYSNNKNIYQGIKDYGQEMHKHKANVKASGLQASKMPKETYKKDEMYESRDGFDMRNLIDTFRNSSIEPKKNIVEQKSIKTVYFKKTAFLNEGHMVSRIPDEFKNEGVQFKMKDKHGTEYLVEWSNGNANVLSCNHKQKINETMNTFHNISSYDRSEYKTINNSKINENSSEISRMLNIVRTIKNKK